jgi:hypothetical protein
MSEEEWEYVYEDEEDEEESPKKKKQSPRVASTAPAKRRKTRSTTAPTPTEFVQTLKPADIGQEPPKNPPVSVSSDDADGSEFVNIAGKILHVKVGDPIMAAEPQEIIEAEIEKVEEKINKLVIDNNLDCYVLVTHYAVDISVVK